MDYTQNPESESHFLSSAVANSDTVPELPVIQPDTVESTADEFKGGLVPLQIRFPSDMRQSLKFLSMDGGESMSDLVMRCLTTDSVIHRAWIQQRKKTKRAA